MKLIKTAQGKQIIKISKKEWTAIGVKAGWVRKSKKESKNYDNWTEKEKQEFKDKHGKWPTIKEYGISFSKDDKGYFCRTHRARSKSKESPAKITKKELDFIESTGSSSCKSKNIFSRKLNYR